MYPAFFLDEDNYEDYHKSLQEIQVEVDKGRIFIGSGEDAPIAWEHVNG
jgi:hypothetical protein